MMEYTGRYWKIMIIASRGWLNRRYGRAYTKELIAKAHDEYRGYLERADDIGGTANPMATNVYLCLVYVALWKAADGRITEQDLRELTTSVMRISVLRLVFGSMNLNKPSAIQRVSRSWHRSAQWLDEHPQYQHLSWDFHFDESLHKDGIYYYFTQCPLNTMARKEGFLEILPVMCDVDYMTAGLMHSVLHREQTLAGGGEKCDYWFVGDQIQNPQ